MRRRTLGVIVLATALASSLVTWVAGAVVRSPAEIAARTAPPDPSPILVPVEQRQLATTVISRGTGSYGSPTEVTLARSRLKDGNRVITQVPDIGWVLKQGDVLLTVSGRPVFVLAGRQPAFRDLGPGLSGDDVRQLEEGLKALGMSPGTVDGVYDAATAAAVTRLYRGHGFEPVVATEAQLARARARESELIAGARARAGVQVPADEVVFLAQPPVRVTEHTVGAGAAPAGPLLTVTDSVVSVAGSLPVESARLVRPGMEVTVDEPALGISTRGRVSEVADRPGTDGADGFHVAFSVLVEDPPQGLVGASVRLTIPVERTEKVELTVPAAAVTLAPDGTSRVQRSVGDRLEFVTVTPGLSAEGFVAVTPTGGTLAAGDLVVVGHESSGTPGG